MLLYAGLATVPEFKVLTGCTCPGYSITYMCTAIGDGFTRFEGSAFNCSLTGNEILLSHTEYSIATVRKTCGNYISAKSLGVSGNHYKSLLMINISQPLNGLSVNCTYISGTGSTVMPIGSPSIIQITRGNNNNHIV